MLGKLTIIATLLLSSCGGGGGSDKSSASEAKTDAVEVGASRPSAKNEGTPAGQSPKQADTVSNVVATTLTPRLLVYTGTLRIQVEQLDSAIAFAKHQVAKYGGYTVSESQEQHSDELENTLKIRVPVMHFPELMKDLEGRGSYVASRHIETEDVTAEFVDNAARQKAKEETERQYYAILKQTKTVKEILDVQEKLGEIREQIETVQGRQKYLSNQAAYSTIDLTMYVAVKQPSSPQEGFGYRLGQSLADGGQWFISFLLGVLSLWPFLLIAGGTGIFLWYRSSQPKKPKSRNSITP